MRGVAAVVEQQAVEVCGGIAAETTPQRQILSAVDHLKRVYLHPADAFDCGVYLLDARIP